MEFMGEELVFIKYFTRIKIISVRIESMVENPSFFLVGCLIKNRVS